MSCDKLVQYGIINNGETYVYSDMDAQRLAISNFDVETNGFNVNTVTIALNLFVQDVFFMFFGFGLNLVFGFLENVKWWRK